MDEELNIGLEIKRLEKILLEEDREQRRKDWEERQTEREEVKKFREEELARLSRHTNLYQEEGRHAQRFREKSDADYQIALKLQTEHNDILKNIFSTLQEISAKMRIY